MRYGLYGFKGDPLHNGHLILAERARVQHKLQWVYLVTSGLPPDKLTGTTDKEVRHRGTCRVCDDHIHFRASRVEIDRDGPSFMADTLRHFHTVHPGDEPFLIIGEDRAPTLREWREPEALVQLCTFLVGPRFNNKIDKDWLRTQLPDGAKFDTVDWDFSSTFIRGELQAGRSVRYIVPDSEMDTFCSSDNPYGVPMEDTRPHLLVRKFNRLKYGVGRMWRRVRRQK